MVTETDLKPIVQSLLDAFPTFDQWFGNLSNEQRTGMRDAWLRQVAALEPSDIQNAADGILDGRVPMPKNYEFDRLGFELKTWGNVEAAKRLELRKTEELRAAAKPEADRTAKGINQRFGRAIKCASAWGMAKRSGKVTQAQNDDAMVLIHRFHKVGDVELPWPQVSGNDQKTILDFWKA